MIIRHEHYINGRWVEAKGGRAHQVIDPSTEEPTAEIMLGTAAEGEAAIAAAKAAQPGWARSTKAERLELAETILAEYTKRGRDIAEALSREMGAPIDMAYEQQVDAGTWHMTNFLTAFRDFQFIKPFAEHAPQTRIAWEPVGVVALITPWNWPMNQIALKVMPALLGGNSSIFKPSEMSPLSAMIYAEVMHAAGTPAGVFNLVNGDGPGIGTQLSTHPDVDMVSFTGSTRAGIAITKAAADTLKKVCLELGGKGANLVFADAGEKAVVRSVRHMFNNSGQSCNAPSRMLVERPFYERAIEIAAQVANETKVGPASQSGKHIGPVVNAAQYEKIQGLIEKGISEGARLVAGGPGRPEGLNRGFFVRPTVFADVTPGMTIEKEEIFGPVLSILPFDSEEEAVRIANDTIYGLTNYVQSEDGARRNRLSRQLRAGMVEMNGVSRGAGAPFGGVKASGRAREGGVFGLEEFMDSKTISGWDGA